MSDLQAPPSNALVDIASAPPLSLRDKILTARDITSETIKLGAPYNCDVVVKTLDAVGRAQVQLALSNAGGPELQPGEEIDTSDPAVAGVVAVMYPAMAAWGTFDPDTGERVFSDADAELLGKKGGEMVELLGSAIGRLSGMIVTPAQKAIGDTPVDALGKGSTDSPG